jgi:DNA polymerase III epsilon subunit-like protein|tara:strand:- start:5727 stop:6368 length:642 start_codon:yes stop_codon:yes gene_type:complete
MNENLLRFKKDQNYLFFDFETCCLNLGSLDNKPWQLGFIVINKGKIVKKKDYWIHWDDLKMSDAAAKMTGWTQVMYNKKAEDAKKILAEFEHYLYDESYINVGHNILGFDIYIHGIFRRCLGKNPDYSYIKRSIDTLCLAKAIKNEIKFSQNDNFFNWQYRLNNMIDRKSKKKLMDLCKDYDISIDESKLHDAMYDIEQNYEVFKKMLWEVNI